MGTHADDLVDTMWDRLYFDEEWQRMNDGPYGGVLDLRTAADAERVIREDNIKGPGPECDYCGKSAKLVKSSEVYGPGRDYGWMWLCRPCQAWVGCHPGTKNALGRVADAELRQAKMAAHAAFDPLWRDHPDPPWGRPGHRKSAYTWLADQLNLSPRHCHIGMMNAGTCRRVVDVCRPFTEKLTAADWEDLDGEDAVWDD